MFSFFWFFFKFCIVWVFVVFFEFIKGLIVFVKEYFWFVLDFNISDWFLDECLFFIFRWLMKEFFFWLWMLGEWFLSFVFLVLGFFVGLYVYIFCDIRNEYLILKYKIILEL